MTITSTVMSSKRSPMSTEDTGRLTPSDLSDLSASFITSDWAKAAGLYRVDDMTGAEVANQKRGNGRNFAGVVFPYKLPGQPYPCKRRLRRDEPDLERTSTGATKPKAKYLSPPGEPNHLYFVPGVMPEMLADVDLPILIVEGEKKALAMSRFAREAGIPLLVVAIAGVWAFRGSVGKETSASGARVPVKGVIPDFDLLTWEGRKVYILFDSNVQTNSKVLQARQALADECGRRRAEVWIAELPKNCDLNGPDDYLGRIEQDQGLQAAISAGRKILERARPAKITKITQKDQLVSIAENIELFRTPEGDPFASVEVNGHRETYALNTRGFKEQFSRMYFEEAGQSPSSQAVQDALETLNGKAKFDSPVIPVHVRFASANDRIYLDLCNAQWEVLEISADGWKVLASDDCPIRFRRTRGMMELPKPIDGGDVNDLRPFLNLRDDRDDVDVRDVQFQLILSWLVACFRPDLPFPILQFTGPPGTAKSTTTRLVRDLTDPNTASHRSCPREERDLMIVANNSWVCSFDNLSVVPDWLSDALCRIATGGSFSTRKLYADDEETIFTAKRPIILNGIGSFANRSDLIDRSLIIELKPLEPSQRKSEREFWAEFEAKRASIFSGLVKAVSVALRVLPSVRLEGAPRMADFAEWGAAAETGLGFAEGSFLKAYANNREGSHSIVLEGSILAEVIQELATQRYGAGEPLLLKDFLSELKKQADLDINNARSKRKDFPKNSQGLRGQLQRLDPNLREIGIKIEFLGKTGPLARYGAAITIDYTGFGTSQTSQTSQVPKTQGQTRDVPRDVVQNTSAQNVTAPPVVTGTSQAVTTSNINGLAVAGDARDNRDVNLQPQSVGEKCRCGACNRGYDYIGGPCPDCGEIITDVVEDAFA